MEKGIENIEKFNKAESDIALLNSHFSAYTRSNKYKEALKKQKISDPHSNRQFFYREGRAVYQDHLLAKGLVPTNHAKTDGSKALMMVSIYSHFSEMGTISEFKFTNQEKTKSAIRTKEGDFELSFVSHRDKIVDSSPTKPLKTVGKLKPHVEELADTLTKEYKLVQLKNNLLTLESEDGSQLSLKITKKAKGLF